MNKKRNLKLLIIILIYIIVSVIVTIVLIVSKNNITQMNNRLNKELNIIQSELSEKNKSLENEIINRKTLQSIVYELNETLALQKNEIKDLLLENNNLKEWANTYNSDLDLLSRLIMAEARGSTEEDMLLVGNVVLNRVNHKAYPDTIREVIYDRGQYSPTWTGAINNTPTEEIVELARRLLDGERLAPENVVFQASFPQGSGTWKIVGNHYYCYIQ